MNAIIYIILLIFAWIDYSSCTIKSYYYPIKGNVDYNINNYTYNNDALNGYLTRLYYSVYL